MEQEKHDVTAPVDVAPHPTRNPDGSPRRYTRAEANEAIAQGKGRESARWRQHVMSAMFNRALGAAPEMAQGWAQYYHDDHGLRLPGALLMAVYEEANIMATGERRHKDVTLPVSGRRMTGIKGDPDNVGNAARARAWVAVVRLTMGVWDQLDVPAQVAAGDSRYQPNLLAAAFQRLWEVHMALYLDRATRFYTDHIDNYELWGDFGSVPPFFVAFHPFTGEPVTP